MANSSKEKRRAKNLEYGQPARRVADNENPVELGEEEEGSYTDQKNKRESSEVMSDSINTSKPWKN